MTALAFCLRISMTSDWQIGSGKGRHRSIDSLVDMDGDGLPYIAASTIRGMWRDAAQLLGSALDAGKVIAFMAGICSAKGGCSRSAEGIKYPLGATVVTD